MEQKKPTPVDTNALVESVKNDMLNVEHGKQWIMSSYAPFKDKVAFPGFADDSFEEVRIGFYDAQKTGARDLYFQQIQAKHQEALLRVKRLQTPSPDIVSIYMQLYNTPAPTTISSASGFFGNTGNHVGNNIFANSSNQQQTWGTPQANTISTTSLFGSSNQSNPFSNPNSTNIFAKPVNSIFGSSSTSASGNIFAKPAIVPTGSSSIFGQSASSNAPVFGASGSSAFGSQSMSNSLFGSSGSLMFGSANPQSGTIFGSQSAATNSIFGSAASSGPAVFGAPATQANPIFGSTTSQPSNIFGSSNTTQSMFGSSNVTPTVFGSPTSVFGSPSTQSTSQSVFGTSTLSSTVPAPVFGSPSTFGTTNAASAGIFSNTSSFLNPRPFSGTAQPTNLFGSGSVATSQPSIFGSASTNVATSQPSFGSIAATSQPSFGATSQPSIFGSTSTNVAISQPSFGSIAATSIFGSTNVATSQPTSVFGSVTIATSQPSVFGSANIATSQPMSIFGAVPTSQPTSIFGSTFSNIKLQTSGSESKTSPFATATQAIFGQPSTFGQTTASTSIFGTSEVDKPIGSSVAVSSSNSLFTTVAPVTTVSSLTAGPFTSVGTSNTPFTAISSPNNPFTALSTPLTSVSSSPFSTVSPFINPSGVIGITQAVKPKLSPRDYAKTNPEYYSTQLTDEDIAAFQNMKFEFGSIPVHPPTVDLCA